MDFKRITIISGHFGSGKTNIAVNLALELKKTKQDVAILDIDIVNPYFRTKDSMNELVENGVTVKKGVFGADMKIDQLSDGPVTIIYDI